MSPQNLFAAEIRLKQQFDAPPAAEHPTPPHSDRNDKRTCILRWIRALRRERLTVVERLLFCFTLFHFRRDLGHSKKNGPFRKRSSHGYWKGPE